MEPTIIGALAGVGSNAINNAMGVQNGQTAMNMQIHQAQQLQQMQISGSKELTQFQNEEAYQQWLRTNYSAQRREMEKAGLNIAMMYGKGGQGGTLS